MVSDVSVSRACCLDCYVLRRSPFVVHMRIPELDLVVTPSPTMNVAMTHVPSPGAVQRPSKRPRRDGARPANSLPLSHVFVFHYVRAHTCPVRIELHERPLGDELQRQVSYNHGALQGHWTFSEGAEGEPNVFEVHFNARPEKPLRMHRFEQIAETSVYRHISERAEYNVILIYVAEESW